MEKLGNVSKYEAFDENDCETSGSDTSIINDDREDEEEDEANNSDQSENFFLDGVDFDHMAEAVKLLENNADVNTENALVLNRNLQDMLGELRNKITAMLNKCREQYEQNEAKLTNPDPITSSLKGIGNCGSPFFKDICGRPCPPNADYIYRSEVEKELFPSDLALYPHFIWTASDKLGLLQGVKEQAIEYIERKESYPSTSSSNKSSKLSKNVKLHSLKLVEVLKKVDNDFSIDWNQISVYNLRARHTQNSCFAMWNVYLRPEINREHWTEEENAKLNSLAKKYKFQNWIAIASEMKGRSDYQCFVQYQTVVSIKMRGDKGERWTKEEDELLLKLVEKNRMGSVIRWNPICSQFPNRTKKQCFCRYKYSINPNISRAPFTPEEDCIILAAVEEYGENFHYFPRALFPNRTKVQIRNRYYNSINVREKFHSWTPEDDKILLHLVAKYGSQDWKKIAEEIERHSRTSCRTRFLVISKFLKENPSATIEDLPRKNRVPVSSVTKDNWMKKIAEIKHNPKANDSPVRIKKEKKEAYRLKLRHNELKWYNYFKYSYDFRFGTYFGRAPACLKGLEFVRCALGAQLERPNGLSNPHCNAVVRATIQKLILLRAEESKSIVITVPPVGYRLPPSFCTLLAYRGICIQTSILEATDELVTKESDNVIEAKRKFRQRIIALLYNTVLLSRVEPLSLVEQDNFRVNFDPNTSLGRTYSRTLAELKVAQTIEIAENLAVSIKKAKRKSNVERISSPTQQRETKKIKNAAVRTLAELKVAQTIEIAENLAVSMKKAKRKSNVEQISSPTQKHETKKIKHASESE